MKPNSTPVLEAINASKIYGRDTKALDRVDVAVHPGETLVLVGESGCGKSTLLRLFNRMSTPTSGEVRFEGKSIEILPPEAHRRRIGYVQQEGGLIPHWTIARNVGLVPKLLNWERDKIETRIKEMLTRVALDPQRFAHRYPSELSGGQRQRAAFARAMAGDPRVVLLDEPFGALDAITRLEIQRQFLSWKGELSQTMVLVTHDLEEAFRLGDRVAVMKDARILQVATPQALARATEHPYVTQLLSMRGKAW